MQIIVYIVAVVLHNQVHELKDIHEKFGGFLIVTIWVTLLLDNYGGQESKLILMNLANNWHRSCYCKQYITNPEIVYLYTEIHFSQIKKAYPDDTRLKVRANMYLEDWHVGEFLQ